ncbi:MAG: DUF167 domain-containing protein [Gemmatimonadales bacterium]|nr:DUF167 domain-containing protein [Gemmatimonadales bacterium]
MSVVEPRSGGSVIRLLVQPRASRSDIVGVAGDLLRVRVAAPPVDGAANEAVIRLLAQALDLPKGRISLLSGLSSRRKALVIEGLSAEETSRRLGLGSKAPVAGD